MQPSDKQQDADKASKELKRFILPIVITFCSIGEFIEPTLCLRVKVQGQRLLITVHRSLFAVLGLRRMVMACGSISISK